MVTNESYTIDNEFLVFDRKIGAEDKIQIEFLTEIQIKEDANKEKHFSYGALFYAKSFESITLIVSITSIPGTTA